MPTLPTTLSGATYNEELGFYSRGKGDEGIWKEQKGWKGLLGVELVPGDKILDLGGHIGMFVKYMKQHRDRLNYHCVEPDPNNLKLLNLNLTKFLVDHTIHAKAVVGDTCQDSTKKLYLGKTYPACNSLEPYQGRTAIDVATVKFSRLLELKPRIIKCDIEGGEYGLDWSSLPLSVRGIGFEFHFNRPSWHDEMLKIDEQLQDQGFQHYKAPKLNTFSKVSFGIYLR